MGFNDPSVKKIIDDYENSPQFRQDEVNSINNGGRPDGHGGRYSVVAGTVSPDWGGGQYGTAGTEAWDQDVDRARRMGEEGQHRTAVQLDQTQANESRGMEMGALGMLRRQGDGSAPSAAAILSNRANEGAVQAAGQQQTAARGIGARIAATGAAGQQAGQTALAGNAANANLRAGEISHGQGSYAGATGAVQGQDIGAATTNAQLEAQQRAMNEARQQEFERRAWNTRNTESMAEDRFAKNSREAGMEVERANLAAQANKSAQDQFTMNTINSGVQGMISGAAKADAADKAGGRDTSGSDSRTKQDIHSMHMGSLGALYRGRGR